MNQDRVTLVAVDAESFCEGCCFLSLHGFCRAPSELKDNLFPCNPKNREDKKYKIWVIEEKAQ